MNATEKYCLTGKSYDVRLPSYKDTPMGKKETDNFFKSDGYVVDMKGPKPAIIFRFYAELLGAKIVKLTICVAYFKGGHSKAEWLEMVLSVKFSR